MEVKGRRSRTGSKLLPWRRFQVNTTHRSEVTGDWWWRRCEQTWLKLPGLCGVIKHHNRTRTAPWSPWANSSLKQEQEVSYSSRSADRRSYANNTETTGSDMSAQIQPVCLLRSKPNSSLVFLGTKGKRSVSEQTDDTHFNFINTSFTLISHKHSQRVASLFIVNKSNFFSVVSV